MRFKVLAAAMLVAFCVLAVMIGRRITLPGEPTLEQRALLRSRGEPAAPVWIVEYLDYQCGSCAAASDILKEYERYFPGQIYVQARFFPLTVHAYALKASIYGECAARQGLFWQFHDHLLEKQKIWSKVSPADVDALFESYAREEGLDIRKLTACVENPDTKETVLEEVRSGRNLGVRQTPTFFINGDMVVGHEPIREALRRIFLPRKEAEET